MNSSQSIWYHMTMEHIKFVYFDVGSVLIDWQDVFSTAAKRYNLEIEDIGSVFDQNCTDITLGRMSSAPFRRHGF